MEIRVGSADFCVLFTVITAAPAADFISSMLPLSLQLKEKLKQLFKLKDLGFAVLTPDQNEFGDYATNLAFILAKQRQASPFLLAEDLRKEIEQSRLFDDWLERVEVKNGYLNFFLKPELLAKVFLSWPRYLQGIKSNRLSPIVVVDYSSPNIGKPLSIAHIRSTIIGDSLARIYGFLGWRVIGDNHIGDWGMLAARLIAAYKKFSRKPLAKLSIEDMRQLYVKYTTREKDKPELTELAKQEVVKLKNGDKENLRIWRVLKTNSLREFKRIYKVLGILPFNYLYGESHYQKISDQLVKDFISRGVAERSQGAVIISLEEKKLPPMVIQKSDEAFLYATSDLATIVFREQNFKPNLVLYVVANEQALHFEQLSAAAAKLKLAPKTKLVHIKFGLILGQDKKKLSTRRGQFVSLQKMIDEAVRRAKKIAKRKNSKLSAGQLKKIAKTIGLGAIKYNDLSQNRNTDIIFDWNRMLSLEGNSAPYLQYTYARLRSILRKAGLPAQAGKKPLGRSLKIQQLGSPERALLCKVLQFQEVVPKAATEFLPSLLANYLFELSALANGFYEKYPVLKEKAPVREQRLSLIAGIAATLNAGLELLGIKVSERI